MPYLIKYFQIVSPPTVYIRCFVGNYAHDEFLLPPCHPFISYIFFFQKVLIKTLGTCAKWAYNYLKDHKVMNFIKIKSEGD